MMLIENRPTVSSELFEDEVVIVNLENGNYYSYSGSGIDIWKRLKGGITATNLKQTFLENLNLDQAELDKLDTAIQELIDEGLITEKNGDPNTNDETLDFRHDKFTTPSLNKFTDMQDLLLLDPIHDVDETGWPMQKENSQTDSNDK
ncbi:PqqD family protein [Reichenbachiella carrageenanivorans]|uniref:PqqD family protein n=1 Tax=Reichenbachiella carrageenanivorans TaxID=2979869 RepID=A0ABY6D3U0_9BACT|nr:PqqD family protein [Reichenbachiella carrageenanivorans]UXX80821.1 PqqD family protein [Reichenbachiella carrageenanivorans]